MDLIVRTLVGLAAAAAIFGAGPGAVVPNGCLAQLAAPFRRAPSVPSGTWPRGRTGISTSSR